MCFLAHAQGAQLCPESGVKRVGVGLGSHRQPIQVARLHGNAEVLLGNAGSIGQRGHWRSQPFSSHDRNGHAPPPPKKMILLSMILPIFLPARRS